MKKINKKIKNAFTLIELVVVIAVIAILSAVSVAAYMGVITSARESSDLQELTSYKTLILTTLLANEGKCTTSSGTFTYEQKDSKYIINFSAGANGAGETENKEFSLIEVKADNEQSGTGESTTNTTETAASKGLISLIGDDWIKNDDTKIGVTISSSSSISTICYQNHQTSKWATWEVSSGEIEMGSTEPKGSATSESE